MKMHRLLNARIFYQSRLHNISLPGSNTIQDTSVPEINCSFCRRILSGRHDVENLFLIRHQSTKTASVLQKSSKKKVKYKNPKRYGELLAVSDKTMTEMKVSISKLGADHLSKLATSSVSLGELHQLTARSSKPSASKVIKDVDPELLQTIKNRILKKTASLDSFKEIYLEDDKCALIFTSHSISNLEEQIKTKQYIDMVKESYYNFRKATLYNQKLQDLQCAIHEGVNQEFDFTPVSIKNDPDLEKSLEPPPRGAHAVFKELFFDYHLDSFDQELMAQVTALQSRGLAHPAIEDIDEESALLSDITEIREDLDVDHTEPELPSLNVKKVKQSLKQKRKAQRDKRRAQAQVNMKQDLKERAARGKQESLHKLLHSHLRLLCDLDMLHEGQQVLQYYRSRGIRVHDQPKVTDIKLYNTLLHGFAGKGKLKDVTELLSLMQEDGVVGDAQTHAAIFECIERCDLSNKEELLRNYYTSMMANEITLNDLVDKTKFLYDQHEVVLKAIRRIQPDFTPVYTPPELDYVCPLLEDLKLENIENRMGLTQSPIEGILGVEEIKQRAREQLEIEIKGDIEIKNISIKDDLSPTLQLYRQKLQETEDEWRKVIKEAFIRNLSTLKSQSTVSHIAITLYPYLKSVDVDKIVELIMGEISKLVDGSESYSPTLKLLQRDLGTHVYYKYKIEQYRRNGVLAKISSLYEKYCEWYVARESVDQSGRPFNGRQAWQMLAHLNREGASMDTKETQWPMEIRQNIGKFLYNIIINDVKIDVNIFKKNAKEKKLPAVYKVHRPWGRLVRLELKPHPVTARLWGGAARPALRLRAPLAPLVAPAPPWRHVAGTASLLTDTPLVRMPYHVVQQWQRLEEAPPASLYPVLDSLNQLGEVPWVINKPLLDLQLQVFRSGGNKNLEIAQPPSALDTHQFPEGTDKGTAMRRRVAINRARAAMYSLWCDALYKLCLANHYRDEIFWLPHNLDFRGRVYACPPHLSQLGADSSRALLKFARPKPLGPGGLRWLKIHAINLTGTMKKNTLDERLAYAESVIDKILDSADNPLDGAGWWMKADEPWQTLACCKEIANAIRSPNHEEYMCSFPVQQDGSCNGLQHYAALGGDEAGARAVNLSQADRPNDVYSATALRVEEMRARDAAAGVQDAIVLENFVSRKVIKQTVMTTVYGVTRFGARLQIAKQLKDMEKFPKQHVWSCSNYLTTRTFDSLKEMFTSTKLIQDWFSECAKQISGVCGESVEWVTPLGLPVVQPYHRRGGTTTTQYRAPLDYQQRPCTMKQRNAFPPNFIHSLDSTHMMLTALRCQAAGICFISVHDCYWTHPHTVDLMNRICREQFVALHSQPILNDLSDFLVKRYSYPDDEVYSDRHGAASKRRVNNLLRKVPSKGDFDLNNVLHSVYFFS